MQRLYFDWNASAPMRSDVYEHYIRCLRHAGNPSSVHREGRHLRSMIEEARAAISTALHADGFRILFTSGATESNNLAIHGFHRFARSTGRTASFLSSRLEHPSIHGPLKELERLGDAVALLDERVYSDSSPLAFDVPAGRIGLCSLMFANNETGHLFDLARVPATRPWHFHCDATQAVGRLPLDLRTDRVDLLTLTSHKIGGPRGVGCLLIRKGCEILPLFHGGSQELGLRPGTENAAAISAFGLAVSAAVGERERTVGHLERLRARLRAQIIDGFPSARFVTPQTRSLPNTLTIILPGIDGRRLLVALDLLGVAVSVGSACASGSIEPSRVLLELGYPPELARGALRISFGSTTTESDVDALVERLKSACSAKP
jgi:cysteine desulfurase